MQHSLFRAGFAAAGPLVAHHVAKHAYRLALAGLDGLREARAGAVSERW